MSQLDELRGQIDRIDAQLTALFLQRMEVTEQVGRWKQANGVPVLDADQVARQVVAPGSPILAAIDQRFPAGGAGQEGRPHRRPRPEG